jgi:hypothetical protein
LCGCLTAKLCSASKTTSAPGVVEAQHAQLGTYTLACDGAPEVLFTENESNAERLWGIANRTPYVKDGINDAVVNGRADG